MKLRPAVVVSCLVLLPGCTGSPVHPVLARSPGPSPSPAPSVSAVQLPTLRLTADLAERPVQWGRITLLPFGHREDELGLHTPPEFTPSEPYAFAIAPDGSVWIADEGKDRLAHYSTSGRYLGALTMAAGGSGTRVWDVVFLGDTMYALTIPQAGRIARVGSDGTPSFFTVQEHRRPLFVEGLFATRLGLVVTTGGYADTLVDPDKVQAGPRGYVLVDPSTGAIRQLSALPIGADGLFSLQGEQSPIRQTATFTSGGVVTQQPIEIRMIRAGSTRPARAVGGLVSFVSSGDDVLSVVQVSADRPRGPRDGGRWLLRIGESPVLWERLPFSDIDDTAQVRRIAVGPDGGIYLMLLEKEGVEILKRP